jgi:hypothetical protein
MPLNREELMDLLACRIFAAREVHPFLYEM